MNYLPKSLVLYITYHCGHSCDHCFLTQKKLLNSAQLSLHDITKILDDAQKSKVFMIPITGGEPLMHPHFFEIVSEIKKRNMLPFLGSSSAEISESLAHKIWDSGIPCVQLSLDGHTKEIHDKIRGAGSFQKTLSNIRNLKKTKTTLVVAICIQQDNYLFIGNILNLLFELNVNSVKVQFMKQYQNTGRTKEISSDEKQWCIDICNAFMEKIGKRDFIWTSKQDSQLTNNDNSKNIEKLHKESISIGANGNVYTGNAEKVIGNIRDGLPSVLYNKYTRGQLI